MMLEHLGETDGAATLEAAMEAVLVDPAARTRDLGGQASTIECGNAVLAAIKSMS